MWRAGEVAASVMPGQAGEKHECSMCVISQIGLLAETRAQTAMADRMQVSVSVLCVCLLECTVMELRAKLCGQLADHSEGSAFGKGRQLAPWPAGLFATVDVTWGNGKW